MKRFKYYQTKDRVIFQDNQKDKLIAITENGIIRFKENCPIKSNRLFQELSWKERDIILSEVDYDNIYTLGDRKDAETLEILCNIFESDFDTLDKMGLIQDSDDPNYFLYYYVEKKDYDTVLKYSINHFLNS